MWFLQQQLGPFIGDTQLLGHNLLAHSVGVSLLSAVLHQIGNILRCKSGKDPVEELPLHFGHGIDPAVRHVQGELINMDHLRPDLLDSEFAIVVWMD